MRPDSTHLTPGLFNEITRVVGADHLANRWGSGLAAVLATPVLVAFSEECARLAVDDMLADGQQTVGSWIDLRHLAATPPGMTVTVRAELTRVEGRRLLFQIVAWDEQETVAEGQHERFVIDVDRFQKRLIDKLNRAQMDG